MQKKIRSYHNSGIKHLIINHVSENINLYFRVIVIFIIGICIGIFAVNQLPELGKENINSYIGNAINVIKDNTEISKTQILKSSLSKNIIIISIIWFLGFTLIGNFLLYFFILITGITFGYTLSAIMISFTFIQGILFFFTGLFLQNIINIPSILFLTVNGIKSSRSILSKQNKSIKYILAKHSACSIAVMIILVLASLIETYLSSNLIYSILQYL